MLWNSIRNIGGICLLVALTIAHERNARGVTVAWDPSPDAATGNIAGYRLYYSTQSFTNLPAGVATNSAFTILSVGNQTTASITNLPAGKTYYFGVTAYNSSGLESDLSNVSLFDDTLPTVALTSPTSGASVRTTDVVTVSASAASASGIVKVDFFDGATLLTSLTAAPFSFTRSFAAGAHVLTAKATDGNNNATTSAAVTITATALNAAPTVVLTGPTNNSAFPQNSSVTITASASDSDGTISKVDFYDGATLLGTDTTSPYSFATMALAAGTHSITAKATDNLGAVATSAAVTISVNANQPPTVALSSPANNSTFVTNSSITIAASASDVDGTISRVDFFDGATLIKTITASPYSFATSALSAGSHTLTAKATDDRGLSTTSSSVTIAIISPTAPTVALVGLSNNKRLSPPITLTATASEANATITQVEFFAGATSIGVVTTAPYTITTPLASGTYAFVAKATDNFGNVGVSPAISASVKPSGPKSLTVY
jgi:hypothetical protein